MAIYHFSAQIISRSAGRSSVAAAAYRAGEKMMDERTGLTHDFTKKSGVDYVEIMLPGNTPAAFKNREVLWQEVEKVEKRKDAQLAREINIALPIELDKKQQINLARDFVKNEFVNLGMCADLAVHDLNSNNPHFHVMLTTRDVSSDGFTTKNRGWNDKKLLEKWRAAWADYANKALESAGFDVRIDHRTLEAQGIDRAPTQHKGPAISAIIERGEVSYVHEQQSAEINAQQIKIDEALAARAQVSALKTTLEKFDSVIEAAEADLQRIKAEAREAAKLPFVAPAQPATTPLTPRGAGGITPREPANGPGGSVNTNVLLSVDEYEAQAHKALTVAYNKIENIDALKTELKTAQEASTAVQKLLAENKLIALKQSVYALFNADCSEVKHAKQKQKQAQQLVPKLQQQLQREAQMYVQLQREAQQAQQAWHAAEEAQEAAEKAEREEKLRKKAEQLKREYAQKPRAKKTNPRALKFR